MILLFLSFINYANMTFGVFCYTMMIGALFLYLLPIPVVLRLLTDKGILFQVKESSSAKDFKVGL